MYLHIRFSSDDSSLIVWIEKIAFNTSYRGQVLFVEILGSWPFFGFSARWRCDVSVNGDIVSSKRVCSRERESMMEVAALLALPEGRRVEQIQITEHSLVIEVEASHPTSCCPLCAQPAYSIKTHYRRVLRDAPCAGRQVHLVLTVRKCYCRNPSCSQKVCTERLPAFVEPWARMTIRCCQHITSSGLATCGNGGARLAARLGRQTTGGNCSPVDAPATRSGGGQS